MSVPIYIVTQEGIYRHAIVGVFTDREDASRCAIDELHKEKDAYHKYAASSALLNVPCDDVELVCTYSKNSNEFGEVVSINCDEVRK